MLLFEELRSLGVDVQRQVSAPLRYKNTLVENAFKIDLLVGRQLVVELKSVERLMPVHCKQVLTHLRLMGLPLGLLINFGEATIKTGIRRIANDYSGNRL